MATLKLSLLLSNRDTATLVGMTKGTSPDTVVNNVAKLITAFNGGAERPGTFASYVEENGAQATGTVTAASAQAADTVTINGVVFTAVSGTPDANQFDISGSNSAAATSLAAAINASVTALVTGVVTASAADAVVTISSVRYDATGNLITLASSNGGRLAVSGARLTGGAQDTATTISK